MTRRCSISSIVALALIYGSILGCATQHGPLPSSTTQESTAKGWWYVQYRIAWPEGTPPLWFVDLFIAHSIVGPVLEKYGPELVLWRFHRRAGRDKAGHQFSFIFYSTPEIATRIFEDLASNSLVKELEQSGFLEAVSYDDPSELKRPHIEDTSDPHWSQTTKRSWPYFIMGVSRMWLEGIRQIAGKHLGKNKPSDLLEMLMAYERIEERLKELWKTEGGHALLHHLNALFGYGPVRIRQIDLFMRF